MTRFNTYGSDTYLAYCFFRFGDDHEKEGDPTSKSIPDNQLDLRPCPVVRDPLQIEGIELGGSSPYSILK